MRGLLVVCALVGCYRDAHRADPPPFTPSIEGGQPLEAQSTHAREPRRDGNMYALDEALADVLSGPLEHIGTGPWFGLFRINACAYRNDRVILVNIYCTTNEMKSFSIVVFSPTRGRAVIYAEAERPISQLTRADYFTFKAETQPPPDSSLRPLSLDFTYDELTAWDEQRYYKWIPACFGGVEIKRPQGGCLKALEPQAAAWKQRNQPFLDDPPEAWYRIVRDMRARAARDGTHVSHPGG